jgi:hypothetical protein
MVSMRDVQKKMQEMGAYPGSEPTQFKKMTANELVQRLIHLPPGQEIGMSDFYGGGCQLIILNEDGGADGVIWDELEVEDKKGEQVKDSTKEHIEVVESASLQEKQVLMLAYQFHKTANQRKGQALMNALRRAAPELYTIMSESPNDPFHDDGKLQLAFDELGFKIRRFW